MWYDKSIRSIESNLYTYSTSNSNFSCFQSSSKDLLSVRMVWTNMINRSLHRIHFTYQVFWLISINRIERSINGQKNFSGPHPNTVRWCSQQAWMLKKSRGILMRKFEWLASLRSSPLILLVVSDRTLDCDKTFLVSVVHHLRSTHFVQILFFLINLMQGSIMIQWERHKIFSLSFKKNKMQFLVK